MDPEKPACRDKAKDRANALASEFHHSGVGFGIYLPRDLHRSIPHSLTQNRNMELIDWSALEWYLGS